MKKKKILEVHCRLFADDIVDLKRIAAEKGLPWSIELRTLVHRALKGERKEVFLMKEHA